MVIHVSKNDRLRLQNVESKINQWHHGGDDPIRGLYPWLPHKVSRTVIKYDVMRNMNMFRWLFALLSVRLFHLGFSSCYRVSETFLPTQTVISHVQVHSHCLAVFLQTSVPSFIRVLLFSASWWRTGLTADTQVLQHLSHLTEMNRQPERTSAAGFVRCHYIFTV